MSNKRKLQLALAILGANSAITSQSLYDITDVKYDPNDFSSGEFGAPFRGREHHKSKKKKGRR